MRAAATGDVVRRGAGRRAGERRPPVSSGGGSPSSISAARGSPACSRESDRAWYYKPNLGGGEFGAQTMVLERPATRPGTFGFGDINRDGDTDLSQLGGRLAGLYELDREDAGLASPSGPSRSSRTSKRSAGARSGSTSTATAGPTSSWPRKTRSSGSRPTATRSSRRSRFRVPPAPTRRRRPPPIRGSTSSSRT